MPRERDSPSLRNTLVTEQGGNERTRWQVGLGCEWGERELLIEVSLILQTKTSICWNEHCWQTETWGGQTAPLGHCQANNQRVSSRSSPESAQQSKSRGSADFSISAQQPRYGSDESKMMYYLKITGQSGERVRGYRLVRHWQEWLKWWNMGVRLNRRGGDQDKKEMSFSVKGPKDEMSWWSQDVGSQIRDRALSQMARF